MILYTNKNTSDYNYRYQNLKKGANNLEFRFIQPNQPSNSDDQDSWGCSICLAFSSALAQFDSFEIKIYSINIKQTSGQLNPVNFDSLHPILFEEAIVTKIGEKTYAKIGGRLNPDITKANLDSYDSFVNFQQYGGSWTNVRRTKANKGYFYSVEQGGTKAYLYADISFFAAGCEYFTHVNVTENNQADCKVNALIDQHYYYANANGVLLDINVYSNPNATTSDQIEFWGNLGFKVREAPQGSTEGRIEIPTNPESVYSFTAIEHTKGEGEVDATIRKANEYDYYEISWAALDESRVSSNGGLNSSGDAKGKLNRVGAAEEYKIYSPVALTARLYSTMRYNSNNLYNRFQGPSNNGCNSVFYDWDEAEKGWKVKVEMNGIPVNQEGQQVRVGTEDISMNQLMYSDFVNDVNGEEAEFPWAEVKIKQGINILKVTREAGYQPHFQVFTLKGFKRNVENNFSYISNTAKVVNIDGKATLFVDFEFEGYSKEEVDNIIPDLDFQCVGGPWDILVQNAYLVSISENVARLSVDLDHLAYGRYLTHADITGVSMGSNPDLKLPETFEKVYYIGGKKITLTSIQGSVDQSEYWGCLGFAIEEFNEGLTTPVGSYYGTIINATNNAEMFFNIVLGDEAAYVELGSDKFTTFYSYESNPGLVTISLGEYYGELTAIFGNETKSLKNVNVSGQGGALIKDNGYIELTAASFFYSMDGDTTSINEMFGRRVRPAGKGWNKELESFEISNIAISGTSSLARNGSTTDDAIGVTLRADFEEAQQIKSMGFWVYNPSENDVNLRLWSFRGKNWQDCDELGTCTAKAGKWTYIRIGIPSNKQLIYNFNISDFTKTGVTLIFDDIALI